MKLLRILLIAVAIAFGLLLVVGFDNVLALFRSRVALFLLIAPVFVLFVWCVYKAFQPPRRISEARPANKDSVDV